METDTPYDEWRHRSPLAEIIELIANGDGPESVIAFCPSEMGTRRAYDLIYKNRSGLLTPDEERELNLFMDLEHILRMAKIRARMILRERQAQQGTIDTIEETQ